MKRLADRLTKLESTSTEAEQRITRIELVDAETGEVGAVIHVGGQPDQTEVLQALEYKHSTNPPRKLLSRNQD